MTSSDSIYNCLQSNMSLIVSNAKTNTKKACQQYNNDAAFVESLFSGGDDKFTRDDKCKQCSKQELVNCAQTINIKIMRAKEKKEEDRYRRDRDR